MPFIEDGWRVDALELNGFSYHIEKCEATSLIALEKRILLAEELTPLTGKGFLRFDLHSQELTEDVYNHVVNAPRLIVTRNIEGYAVAFIASATMPINGVKFYHLGGIIVDPTLQGTGLALRMLRGELSETGAEALVLRTQSKKMLGLAAKVTELDPDLTLQVAPLVYPQNLEGCVNHGVYRNGHSLYEDEERFVEDAIDTINWKAGDSLVVAGWVKKGA